MMTRRLFSAIAGATPLAANAKPIRVAMIGTGHGHAASKMRALKSMPEYQVAGVSRPDTDDPVNGGVLQTVQQLSLDQVLQDDSIELVALESADAQRNLHYAAMCADAGKSIHLDKPPGSDLLRLRHLLETARNRRLAVQMGYQWRYHPAMQAAIEAARKGWLGRIYRFRASIDKPIGPEERLHLAKYRGGMMFSEGCHLVDRATALLGRPDRVSGFIRHHSPLDDRLADNSLVVLDYSSTLAEISLAGFDPHGNAHRCVEILGTNGFARAQPFSPVRLTVKLKEAAGPYRAGEQILEPPAPPGLPYTPDFAELAAVIRRGATPSYTAEHDLMTHEVLLQACGMA
jgi:predicted dehydrogenase